MSRSRFSKRGTGHHSGNGPGRELQALLNSAVVQIPDKDDAAGQIPWRTSRRLQEATLRSLCKDRDIDGSSSAAVLAVKKEESPDASFSVRSLKRLRSPPSPTTPLELCRSEELVEDGETTGESGSSDENAKKGIIIDGREVKSRKRKRRTVHFADPLFFVIEDKKHVVEVTRKPSVTAVEKKASTQQQARKDSAGGLPELGIGNRPHHLPKLPMSCFDLLCNYVGTKGWKCYRHCVEGESYCSFHLSSQKPAAPPIVRISLCT